MFKKAVKQAAFSVATIAALSLKAHAQSADSLIEKLVDKGILTDKEASELRDESDKDFTTAFQSKTGMPDWVTGYKFSGDFRGRYEENNAENPEYYTRDRFRYRLRVGVTVSMLDHFETGFRLGSGNPLTAPNGVLVGGSSITANQDLNSLEAANFIWIDAAYGKWSALNGPDWSLSFTLGKMDNPFQLSNMVWDYDINPAGGAMVLQRRINDKQSLKAIGGFFALDELNQGFSGVSSSSALGSANPPVPAHPNHDPFVYGAQLLWQSQWTPKVETSLGVAVLDIAYKDSLSAQSQPFYNAGNTRNLYGFLVNNYNPIIGSASATYKLATFPAYNGVFPITASGEYMNNPGAEANNVGYRFGLQLGKAGTKHTWQVAYRYQRLDADAWYDALEDDDNGGYYSATPGTVTPAAPNGALPAGSQLYGTGKNLGWYGGTNVKGHLVQATYSFTDFLDLSVTFYLNSLIIGVPQTSSGAQHFMVDMAWRF